MGFRFPFTNLSELNLDWVLSKVKEITDKVDKQLQDLTELEEKVDGAVYSVDHMTVEATTLQPEDDATATKSIINGHINIDFGIPKGEKGDPGQDGQDGAPGAPATDAQVQAAVNTWLSNNVDPDSGYVLDSTLTQPLAAAPADIVGEIKAGIAGEFNASYTYQVGSFVWYQGSLYCFVKPHAANDPWSASEVTVTGLGNAVRNSVYNVAPYFSESASYTAGEYVVYYNMLFKFTSDHAAGAWDASDVTFVHAMDEVADLKSQLEEFDTNINETLGFTRLTQDSTANGWALQSNGLCRSVNTFMMIKYQVTAGDRIYIKSPKPPYNDRGSYQFQSAASVPSSGTNANLIGSTVTTATNGYVDVPTGATYLIISCLKTDNESGVYRYNRIPYLEEHVAALEKPDSNILLANENALNKIMASRWLRSETAVPLTLLWFSDIHRDKASLDRIIEVKNYLTNNGFLDDTICTGDIVYGSSAEATPPYTYFQNFWLDTPGTEDILIAIGNHEWYQQGSSPHGKESMTNINSYYFTEFSEWGAVREGSNPFYYKDYPDQGIRLIVTDPAIEAEADETTWLQTTLAGAKTLGYSVIVASHYVRLNSGTEIQSATPIDNNWTNNASREEASITMNYDWTGSCDIVDCVTDFIANGGKFMCYLVGHWHWDILSYPTGHPDQLIITIAAATDERVQTKLTTNDLPRYENTRTQDAFNVLTFDAENNLIKCVRVGSDMNMYEQPRTAFAYDVTNHTFISVI